jgi:hypothetical protein
MSLTGIMLYIVPKGKIAYWANWKMFGLTKTQYADIHITMMMLFLVVTIWHIYYNWKPLISYIKNETKQITFLKKELLIAVALNVIFVAGTLTGLQPFKTVLDINEDIKNYWEKEYGSPPFGHAEEASLQSFSQRMGINVESAMAQLKEQNIAVESKSQLLLDIAEKNGVPPKVISDIIKPKKQQNSGTNEITSLGRRTLQELSDMNVINLKATIKLLNEKGFEGTPQSRMKDAANAMNMTPYELFEILKTPQN